MECLLVWAPNVAAKLEGIVELRAAPSGRASELVDASPKEDRINYLLDDSMRWMVFRHPSLSVKLFHGRMSGNERKRSMDAQAGSATPATPELLAPQLFWRPAPAAALVVIGIAAAIAFMSFGDRAGPAGAGGTDGEKVFSVSADQ